MAAEVLHRRQRQLQLAPAELDVRAHTLGGSPYRVRLGSPLQLEAVLVKHPRLETGLKAALRAMGRDCGNPRPPSKALGEVADFGPGRGRVERHDEQVRNAAVAVREKDHRPAVRRPGGSPRADSLERQPAEQSESVGVAGGATAPADNAPAATPSETSNSRSVFIITWSSLLN